MLLAIDPDVFEAALNNNKECEQVLNWVADNLFKYEFAGTRKGIFITNTVKSVIVRQRKAWRLRF